MGATLKTSSEFFLVNTITHEKNHKANPLKNNCAQFFIFILGSFFSLLIEYFHICANVINYITAEDTCNILCFNAYRLYYSGVLRILAIIHILFLILWPSLRLFSFVFVLILLHISIMICCSSSCKCVALECMLFYLSLCCCSCLS